MGLIDIPIFSMLRTRMNWHQERQRLLAENISNSDTPEFQPRDLAPPKFDERGPRAPASLTLSRTSPLHLVGDTSGSRNGFQVDRHGGFEVRPTGNAVSLEDQMMKVASNQMDFQAATTLYTRSLGLIKTALGKR
jgi:flagellar basal-body rod protein FlgB